MALNVPDIGSKVMLERTLNKAVTGDVKIHIYSNSVVISDSNVIGDFTLVTTPAGISLAGAGWTVTGDTASYAQQVFAYSGGGVAEGYVVTDAAEADVIWAEEFDDGPYTIPSGGGNIKVTPTITLD